jgi:hypothetical protein
MRTILNRENPHKAAATQKLRAAGSQGSNGKSRKAGLKAGRLASLFASRGSAWSLRP